MYKLTNNASITRTTDSASIPNDPANNDYADYLEWLAEGNTPLPADQPTPQQLLSEIETAIAAYMDSVARSKRYDNRDSCRLYAGYTNPFQVEATAFGQWVAQCWMVSNTAQADIIAGTRTIPTPAEAIAELPMMVWPV